MYEYKILETDTPTATVEQLNEFGENGWQLQTILPWKGRFLYYFVRMKAEA